MEKRVVITGMGIYSCLGKNLDEVKNSLYNGVSGIVLDPERKELGFRSGLTSKLDIPDLKGQLSRAQRVFMPEQAKYAYVATVEALKNANIDQDYLNKNDVLLFCIGIGFYILLYHNSHIQYIFQLIVLWQA